MNSFDDYISKALDSGMKALDHGMTTMDKTMSNFFNCKSDYTVTSTTVGKTEDWRSPSELPNGVLEYKIPLPGFAPSEISVSYKPKARIEVRAKNSTTNEEYNILSSKEIDASTVSAKMKYGLLTVTFKQIEPVEGQKIEIKVQNT